jgi:hypothetical protein
MYYPNLEAVAIFIGPIIFAKSSIAELLTLLSGIWMSPKKHFSARYAHEIVTKNIGYKKILDLY